MKDGKLLQSDDHTKIHQDEEYSTLSIKWTREADAGNYTCHAKNPHGSDSFSTQLVVQGKIVDWFKQSTFEQPLFPYKSTTDMETQAQ